MSRSLRGTEEAAKSSNCLCDSRRKTNMYQLVRRNILTSLFASFGETLEALPGDLVDENTSCRAPGRRRGRWIVKRRRGSAAA